MTLTSRTIPNLIQGVSQQPAAVRRETQNEGELNALASVVEGLKKRPPLEVAALYSSEVSKRPFIHTHTRSSALTYSVIIQDNKLYMVDTATGVTLDALEMAPGHPLLYDDTDDLRNAYSAVSVADKTFIARRDTIVATRADVEDSRPYEALVSVRAGAFGQVYNVTLTLPSNPAAFGDYGMSYQTPNGEDFTHNDDITTDVIAYSLCHGDKPSTIGTVPASAHYYQGYGLSTGEGLSDYDSIGFTVTLEGSTIHISHADPFTIVVTAGQGDTQMVATMGSVQNFSDLPKLSPVDGFVCKITNNANEEIDDYYVKYDKPHKVWTECLQPGVILGFDLDTMPFILTHEVDDTFTLTSGDWNDRTVGSALSAPDPDYVGHPITGLSFLRGRLGIHAAETIYYSKLGDFTIQYPETVTTVLADAPFGLQATGEKVTDWRFSHEFSDRALIFSDGAQGSVITGNAFTPDSTKLTVSTQFAAVGDVSPVVIGQDLFFLVKRGEWDSLYQLSVNTVSDKVTGEDMTEHVPKYIPAGSHSLAGSLTEKTLAVATDGDPEALYVWRYVLNGETRAQSAWTRWTLMDARIDSIVFIGTKLSVFYANDAGSFMGVIDISPAKTDDDQSFLTLLDYRISEADCIMTYNPTLLETEVTHYDTSLPEFVLVSRGGDDLVGEIAVVKEVLPGVIKVEGDWTDRLFYAGRNYDWIIELTKLFVRDQDGAALEDARNQVRHLVCSFSKTGFLQIRSTPLGRQTYTKTFEGHIYDSPAASFDEVALEDGTLSAGIMSDGATCKIELHNPTHLPCAVTKARWTGSHNPRHK